MTRLTAVLMLVLLAGCFPQEQVVVESEPSHFSEKVRCSSVGERYLKEMCREATCQGWWGYNAERDTCIGVITSLHFQKTATFRSTYLVDMLTNVEIEDWCWGEFPAACNPEPLVEKWISGGGE